MESFKIIDSSQQKLSLQKNRGTIKQIQEQKLKDAAQSFESFLVYQMFKSLNKNIGQNSLIKENSANKLFNDLLIQERSDEASKKTSFGIAEAIYNQNIKYIK